MPWGVETAFSLQACVHFEPRCKELVWFSDIAVLGIMCSLTPQQGLAKPSRALPGNLAAQVFAVQSGGRFLSSSNDLSEHLSRCFEDAAYRYELSYQPSSPEAGDTYHSIQVKVNRGDTEVHTLQGYYTAPAGSAEGTVAAP